MTEQVEVIVGVVGKAHGIKGEVFIDVRTDEPGRRFTPGAGLLASGGKTVVLDTVRWHRGRLVARFVGFPDRTAVETLKGQQLLVKVSADELPSQEEEYFDRQLVGLRVLDSTGAQVGVIAEVLHLPAQDCLGIDTADGRHLVPFVTALVPRVDLAAGEIQLAEVGGLLGESL